MESKAKRARIEAIDSMIRETLSEQANQAGMVYGVHGYNDWKGYDLSAPDPCGHHCGSDCHRCGE